jgi:putative heme iron utilization protein
MTTPIRPTDDQARALAVSVLHAARTAALGVLDASGAPMVTRIGFGLTPDGAPLTLISHLAAHTKAMLADPRASLLIGEPGPKGDPLTHARLTLLGRAKMIPRTGSHHATLATEWVATRPKAKLYIGFSDFQFVQFTITAGHLNGGFGRAFRLTPDDMEMPARPAGTS